MCRNKFGFWSIDAAFALVMSVAMFAIFSSIIYAASTSAARGADDASSELVCLRFSSYALSQLERGEDTDLQSVLQATGRRYASLRVGEEFSYAGEKGIDVYCTQRLMATEGKMVKMEACIG